MITTQNRLEIASQGSVLVLMNHVSRLITLSRSFSCLIIPCIVDLVDLPSSVLWGVGIRSTPFYLLGCTVLVSSTIGRYTSVEPAGAVHGTLSVVSLMGQPSTRPTQCRFGLEKTYILST